MVDLTSWTNNNSCDGQQMGPMGWLGELVQSNHMVDLTSWTNNNSCDGAQMGQMGWLGGLF
jgi:hypothetical protein